MGFLKELFEKKLKTTGGKGYDEGLEIGRSAQSEWSLPQLRTQHSMSIGVVEESSFSDDPALNNNSICYLQIQQSAKSFSFAAQRTQQLEQNERISQANTARWQSAARVKYESVSQFSQKVELYRGSVATVFKAVCNSTNMKVIIKAYYKQKMHPKHFHKLQREIQAMKALNGPYVAEFYATFEDSQCVYIIMEFCEGGDLFKTMLMHGGLLDEQWVCIEVITPLLRILEKMHSLKLLHRDIKPENIFLTALGRFKLGDFGLAIKYDDEVAFSRSGTLDYMAPEVLKNPSVPFQESKSVDVATLAARGVKPYGPPVDVWATGVLAYELVCGRPPFEVEDEAQTAALIMYSDAIKFPPNRTPQWTEFVKSALIKNPDMRPTAAQLLKHPWVVANLQHTMSENHRPSKEMLLQPLPLDMAQKYAKELKRTMSLAIGTSSRSKDSNMSKPEALAPLQAGGKPSVMGPTLPAAFPATPTGVQRQLQHVHLGAFDDRDSSSPSGCASNAASGSSSSSSRSSASANAIRPSGLSVVTSSLSLTGNAGLLNSSSAAAADRVRDIQAVVGDGERSESGSILHTSPPRVSFNSPLHPSTTSAAAVSVIGSGSTTPTGRSSSICGSGVVRPNLGLGLKVTLPPETELEICGSSDSFCFSPLTPAPKPGIKERMKFYFQRQAGSPGNSSAGSF